MEGISRADRVWMASMRIGQKCSGCHQMPERSFFVGGYQLPLCARCTGIVIGHIIGAAASLFHPVSFWSLIGTLPLMADGLIQKYTSYESTNINRESMMTGTMKLFCRMSGKNRFTDNDIESMEETAALKAADRNPYSWNMDFMPYEDGSGYEARFTHCGICILMKKLKLFEYVPAMCRLDYAMSEASGVSDFVREYTLASGGPFCDCGYKKSKMG